MGACGAFYESSILSGPTISGRIVQRTGQNAANVQIAVRLLMRLPRFAGRSGMVTRSTAPLTLNDARVSVMGLTTKALTNMRNLSILRWTQCVLALSSSELPFCRCRDAGLPVAPHGSVRRLPRLVGVEA